MHESTVVVVVIWVDLPEDNGSGNAPHLIGKMRVVAIVGVRNSPATRNRAEIEALDVERVVSGYRRAVEDDSPDAACRRVVRGYFLGAFEGHEEHSGHEIS